MCRLGRHVPFLKVRDGVLRVGKSAANKVGGDTVDRWFEQLGDFSTAALLKLYSRVN